MSPPFTSRAIILGSSYFVKLCHILEEEQRLHLPPESFFPTMLFVCLLFKNYTCITLTYSWLCDGIARLLDTQIMQITKWRGGKKERGVQQMCIFQKSLCSESACPGSGHQPHNPSQICGGH